MERPRSPLEARPYRPPYRLTPWRLPSVPTINNILVTPLVIADFILNGDSKQEVNLLWRSESASQWRRQDFPGAGHSQGIKETCHRAPAKHAVEVRSGEEVTSGV